MKTRYGSHGISGVLIRACLGISRAPQDPERGTDRSAKEKGAAPIAARPHKVKSRGRKE